LPLIASRCSTNASSEIFGSSVARTWIVPSDELMKSLPWIFWCRIMPSTGASDVPSMIP
jgi:hypothetical protein